MALTAAQCRQSRIYFVFRSVPSLPSARWCVLFQSIIPSRFASVLSFSSRQSTIWELTCRLGPSSVGNEDGNEHDKDQFAYPLTQFCGQSLDWNAHDPCTTAINLHVGSVASRHESCDGRTEIFLTTSRLEMSPLKQQTTTKRTKRLQRRNRLKHVEYLALKEHWQFVNKALCFETQHRVVMKFIWIIIRAPSSRRNAAVVSQPNTFSRSPLHLPHALRPWWAKRPGDLDFWPYDLESDVLVTCDVGYLSTNFGLPRPLCSRVKAWCTRQTDRQTDVRRKHRLMPPTIRGINRDSSATWCTTISH